MHDRARVADGEGGGGGSICLPTSRTYNTHNRTFTVFFALQRLNGYVVALEIFISACRDNAANDKEDGSRRDRYSSMALK